MRLHEKLFEEAIKSGYSSKIYQDIMEIRRKFEKNEKEVVDYLRKIISEEYLNNVKTIKELYNFLLAKLLLSTDRIGEFSLLETQARRIMELASKHNLYGVYFIQQQTRENKLLELRRIDINTYIEMKKNLEIYDKLENLSKLDEELEDLLERKIEEIVKNRRIEEIAKEIFE